MLDSIDDKGREKEVAQSCPTLSVPWTAVYQAPPSMGFSRQKYWRGSHCLLRPLLLPPTKPGASLWPEWSCFRLLLGIVGNKFFQWH